MAFDRVLWSLLRCDCRRYNTNSAIEHIFSLNLPNRSIKAPDLDLIVALTLTFQSTMHAYYTTQTERDSINFVSQTGRFEIR